MAFTLKSREATLIHINVRTEKHGKEQVPARDLLLRTLVSKGELNRITRDKFKFSQMYDVGVKPIEPLWKGGDWQPHAFKTKFTDCEFELFFGVSNKTLTVDGNHPVRIKGIKFIGNLGGQTTMEFLLQANFELNAELAELEAFQGKPVTLESLTFGKVDEGQAKKKKGAQGELGLDHNAEDEDGAEEEEESDDEEDGDEDEDGDVTTKSRRRTRDEQRPH
ncbi:MAG TPA: hypothetical protein VGD45_20490 [Steroidobacter sp.]|uniref:hypothetical protein n=1 Tax=Steroidobacter sp. TaxID=1978227 RepID=UPI002EDA48FF